MVLLNRISTRSPIRAQQSHRTAASPSPYTPINVMRSAESCGERTQIYCKCCCCVITALRRDNLFCSFCRCASSAVAAAVLRYDLALFSRARVHKHERRRAARAHAERKPHVLKLLL